MTVSEVHHLTMRLMRKYNILGWRLMIEDMPGFRGCCDPTTKTISLCPKLLQRKEIEIIGVILHEISHILSLDEKQDHGPKWNKKLAELIADFSFVGA